MKNTKSYTKGQEIASCQGPDSNIQALPTQCLRGGLPGSSPIPTLEHLSALATGSLSLGTFVIWEQNVGSWHKMGKESHKKATSSSQNSHPQHLPHSQYQGGPPCMSLSPGHLALP